MLLTPGAAISKEMKLLRKLSIDFLRKRKRFVDWISLSLFFFEAWQDWQESNQEIA
jgi:hypothetical protein